MYRILFFFSLVFVLCFFVASSVSAVSTPTDVVKLINPIGGTSSSPRGATDPSQIFGLTINYALGLIGSITLAVFVWGGFLWLTSGGSPDRIKTGTNAMVWATIGLLVIFASYAILYTILSGLGVRGVT